MGRDDSNDVKLNEPTTEFPEYDRDGADADRAVDTERRDGERRDSDRGAAARGLARPVLWLLGIIGLIVALLLVNQAIGLWPKLSNPFAQKETDRSQPVLLQSIQDLSRYVAAEGNYQVVIDVQRNRENVPDFLLNRRTLFVGAGSVEAFVDFSTIGEGAITVSDDGKTVSIKLPDPQLGKTNLDLERSYVVTEQRGLLDWVKDVFANDPNRQNQVYQLAEERISTAARDSGLIERARENTRKMLEGLLHSLGYTTVTVTYASP